MQAATPTSPRARSLQAQPAARHTRSTHPAPPPAAGAGRKPRAAGPGGRAGRLRPPWPHRAPAGQARPALAPRSTAAARAGPPPPRPSAAPGLGAAAAGRRIPLRQPGAQPAGGVSRPAQSRAPAPKGGSHARRRQLSSRREAYQALPTSHSPFPSPLLLLRCT